MSERLTTAELAKWRAAQPQVCALCGSPATAKNPFVADHDHKTGHLRGLLHRGCNAMLGHIENNGPRYFLTDIVKIARMLGSVAKYLAKDYTGAPLYPTFRDEEEKKALKAKRAKARRAKAKADKENAE